MEWAQVSVWINAAELAALVWLVIHLRHSSAPIQAALIDSMRKELDVVRGNLGRMKSDHLEYRHELVESDTRIWEELRRLNSRLDEFRCPLGHAECPLNGRKG